jgi:hypothetical protein
MEQLFPPRQWRALWSADCIVETKLILSILQPSEPTIANPKAAVSSTGFLLHRRGYRILPRTSSTNSCWGSTKLVTCRARSEH